MPITRPDLGPAEAEAAARVVRSGWVVQGPEVGAFEAELAAFVGAPHAVAVANGTVAMELALRALGVGPGDEVITVSHSFIATANAVVAVGARPVFVDVEEATLGMDPRLVPRAVGPRTKAILCVHQVGIPCDITGVLAAAGEIPVVEDAACALGSDVLVNGGWQPIGRPHGRLATFSFHPRKVVTTGEGGMITTADPALAARLRQLRSHGADSDGRFVEGASNARMSDVHAAIGRPQVARLAVAIAERRRLAAAYEQALDQHPVLAPPAPPPWTRPNWQSYPVQVRAGRTQAEVMAFLAARGIDTRPGIGNAHEEPAHGSGVSLPISERLRRQTVLLPLFHGLTPAEEQRVVAALHELRRS